MDGQFQLLFELNLTSLQTSTKRAFPQSKKRQNIANQVTIHSLKLIPIKADNQLLAKADTSTDEQHYLTQIQFDDVEYLEKGDPDGVTFTGVGGQHTVVPLNRNQADVKVSCTCEDFYWRFGKYNFVSNALLGQKPPPYRRKTTTRGPANPKKLPGMCKHVFKVAGDLFNSNLLV